MGQKTKMRIIKWSNPPEENSSKELTRRKKLQGWDAILAKLAEKPGEWALIRTSVKRVTVTQAYTEKRFKGYEFVSRKYYVGSKPKYGVWARKLAPTPVEEINVPGTDVIVKEQFIDLTETV